MSKDSVSDPTNLSKLAMSSPPELFGSGSAVQSDRSVPSLNDSAAPYPPMPPPPKALRRDTTKIFDDATVTAGYESVPLIKIDTLPRGGISFETKGVGRVQVSLR
jgi:hypothetical protein